MNARERDILTTKPRDGASVENFHLGCGTGYVTQVAPLPRLAMMLTQSGDKVFSLTATLPLAKRKARCPLARRWRITTGTTLGRMLLWMPAAETRQLTTLRKHEPETTLGHGTGIHLVCTDAVIQAGGPLGTTAEHAHGPEASVGPPALTKPASWRHRKLKHAGWPRTKISRPRGIRAFGTGLREQKRRGSSSKSGRRIRSERELARQGKVCHAGTPQGIHAHDGRAGTPWHR